VRQALKLARRDPQVVLADFWVGFAVLVVWLQLWNFVAPVTIWVWLPLVPAAVWGLTRGLARVSRPSRLGGALLLVFVGASTWLANLAIQGPLHADSGGYHLSMLRWVQEYPVVPGLADLHTRFGYNSSEFLYVAAVGGGPWHGQGFHLANGILLLALLAEVTVALYRVVTSRRPRLPDLVLVVAASAVVDRFANGFQLTSPAPDLAAFVVSVLLAVYLMRAVDTDSVGPDLAATIALAAVGPVLRLQLLPMACVAVVVLLLVHRRKGDRRDSLERTRVSPWRPALVLPVVALLSLAWGSWMARGILLSGYPLFPSTVAGLRVGWRVPGSMAKGESDSIRAWARDPGGDPDTVLGGWGWLGSWWRQSVTQPDVRFPLAVLSVAAALVVLGYMFRLRRAPTYSRKVAVAALLPVSVATVAWFWSAPDPRFNAGPLWVGAGTALALVASTFAPRGKTGGSRWATVAVLTVAGVLVVHSLTVLHQLGLTRPFTADGAGVLGTIDAPRAHVTSYATSSGLRVYVPTDGQCWSSRLPCAPKPLEQLRLRGAGLASGFTLDGGP
jgi:hypothetical protein